MWTLMTCFAMLRSRSSSLPTTENKYRRATQSVEFPCIGHRSHRSGWHFKFGLHVRALTFLVFLPTEWYLIGPTYYTWYLQFDDLDILGQIRTAVEADFLAYG